MIIKIRSVGSSCVDAEISHDGTTIQTSSMDLLDAICFRAELKEAVDELDEYIQERARRAEQ